MKKVLLGSTALVAAGLMAGPAFAQLELSISGTVDVHAGWASEDLDTNRREYGITTDTTLDFEADGVADNGLEYGARINIDDTTALNDLDFTTTPTTTVSVDVSTGFKVDETWVFVSGGFGEIRFGETDPAASEFRLAVPSVGNGQADGDFGRYVAGDDFFGTNFEYDSDDSKILYFFENSGLTAGVSYSPDSAAFGSDSAQADANGTLEDIFSLGGNYEGEFNNVSFGISAGVNFASLEETSAGAGNEDDLTEYGVGAEVGFGAITVGGFYIHSELDDADEEIDKYGIGATFSTGPWSFGANALLAEADPSDAEDSVYGVGVEYTLADGLAPYADLVFFDFDNGGGIENDGTVLLVGVTATF